ncbi:MAG: response regulator [Rhodobacteraceae bacterium]|nr:response regulator [Paracoccaceae bacterium]
MDKLPEFADKKFLVVDDEAFMLSMIDRMLKQVKAGSIVKATDGGTALRAVKDNFTQVDCIISDCNMKPINGLQLLRGVRMGLNPNIPRDIAFIMLTGHGETELVKSAIALDVSGYAVKPVSLEKLAHTITQALKKTCDLKEPEYYKGVKLPEIQSGFAEDQSSPKAWTILPRASPFKTNTALKDKIEQFKKEHATRDGEGDIKIKNRRQCRVNELHEGQILAEDIEAEEGVILLRKGTQLTKGMINRLRELATDTQADQSVWVGELAD